MAMPGREQFLQAARDLRDMPKEIRRELAPTLRRVAQPIAAQARANASWSSRIPGAIRVAVLKRGVSIRVSARKAPHARPYEGITGQTFRHPVFGDRDRWVAQRSRPFLEPAVKAHQAKVRDEIVKVVDDAARRHGFR